MAGAAPGPDEEKLEKSANASVAFAETGAVVEGGGDVMKLNADPPFTAAACAAAVVTAVAAGGGEIKLKEDPVVVDAIGLEAAAAGGGTSTVADLGAIDAVAAAEKFGLNMSVELPVVGAESDGVPNASKFA